MDPIRTAIRDYLLEEFLPGEDPEELSDDTPLITGGVLDSISTLKLVVYLEERFGISLEAHEAGVEHLDTVDRIASLVEQKQSKAA
jgi:acyl carrier protein